MNPASKFLESVIPEFRDEQSLDNAFDRILDSLSVMLEDRTATPLDLSETQRWQAGLFVLRCIDSALTDHRIGHDEKVTIQNLKYLLGIEEGDLLRLHSSEIHALLSFEMQCVLSDECVTELEARHQSDLQLVLGKV